MGESRRTLAEVVPAANLRIARAALERLGTTRKEASSLLERAQAQLVARGEACSVEALTTEALRLRP